MKPTPVALIQPKTKLFVLDTNVLMHDPTSLFRFKEHDLYVPMVTLEELDANKKGMSEVARNARQASRFLDDIVSPAKGDIERGIAPVINPCQHGADDREDAYQAGFRHQLQHEIVRMVRGEMAVDHDEPRTAVAVT